MDVNYRLIPPPLTRQTAIGGYPRVASYDMLGEQLHYSIPVKHFFVTVILLAFISGKRAPFIAHLSLGNRNNQREPDIVSLEVTLAQQCYFRREISACSRHCAPEHCYGEATMIFFVQYSLILIASNVARRPYK